MTNRILIASIVLLWLLLPAVPAAQQSRKPQSSSVEIDYDDPPATMKTGDQVTTTIVFTATADTERLEVFLDPDDGLELVATAAEAVFTDIPEGETRQLPVKVKLTHPKGSSLSVSIVTVYDGRQGALATAIEYGNPRG